jgi:type IV pilus assembly protein PilA
MTCNRKNRRGFSLIELLIVISIILIIIMIAVPKMNKAQMFAKETAALGAIRALHSAQVQYQAQYGRFATTLTELGPPASGASSASAADLIGTDLAAGEKQGYKFTMTGSPAGYVINASPVAFNATGTKSYYSDHTMTIRENSGPEPATAQSKEVK